MMEDTQKEHTGNKGGKKRKRMKTIHQKIREQMEFYFGNSNLHKDRFLKKAIEATTDGYIELTTFLTFNKIKALTDSAHVLADALSYSTDLLQVNTERTCVKRTTPIAEPQNIDERTVYVEHLPHTANHEWVKKLFSSCGKVSYVSMPRYASTGDLKGFAFVEFETIEGAQEACKELNNPPVEMVHGRVGMFPKSSHQLEALKKQLPEEEIKETEEKAKELVTTEEECTKAEADDSKPDESVQDQHSHTKLKRCRTQSEGSVEKLKSGSDSEIVPAKRKKQEVSFDLPPEDDAEKSGVAGKKRSRKRKNRSKTIDVVPHGDEQDLSISIDGDKSSEALGIPEKRRKIDTSKSENGENNGNDKQTDESNMESAGSATEGEKEGGQKSKKRHRKRKQRKEKELPELRVISKKEWLELRTEYLHLQKTSMALMKTSLSKRQKQQIKQKEREEREAEEKKKSKEIEFVADVIVKVTSTEPIIRKKLKEKLGEEKQIAYIDVLDGTQDGHIRCKDSQSASAISASTIQDYTFTPVTGEEEKQYWDKLVADRETKLKTKTKHRKRGHQKWLDKAQKVSVEGVERKHVVFEDD